MVSFPHFSFPDNHLAPTSSHIPTWAPQWIPQFCRQCLKMQPKVVLKEISLILLHNPPACLPFALCSFKSMEHTFPHSRPRPWCNDKPDTTEHSGGNGEEFSHGKWLVMVAVRALLRAGTQTQPQVPANTPLLHPSPPAHQ